MEDFIITTDIIDQYDHIVGKFLHDIFGISEYIVSDYSTLSDFSLSCLPEDCQYEDMSYEELACYADELMVKKIYERYGILTSPSMTLVEVCEMMYQPTPTVH